MNAIQNISVTSEQSMSGSPGCRLTIADLDALPISLDALAGTPDAPLANLIVDHRRARAEATRYYDEVARDAREAAERACTEVDGWFVEILCKGEVDRCLKPDSTEVRAALIRVDVRKEKHGETWREHCFWMDLEIYDSMERHKERVVARKAEIRAEVDIDKIRAEEDRLSDIQFVAYGKIVDFPVTTIDGLLAKIEFQYSDDDDFLLTEKLLKDLHRIARNEQRHLHAIAGEC